MQKQKIIALAFLLSGLGWSSVPGLAQQSASPANDQLPSAPAPAPSSTSKTGKDKSKTPPAAETQPPTTPTDTPAPDAQQTPAPAAKKPSTAEDNPFPEDVSKQAAAAAAKDAATNAATPGNVPSSAKSPSDSSSLDNTDKLGLDDPARKQLKVESPDGSTGVYDPKRATEDVKVGKFYLQTGHYKGAYDRFKDATVFDHENIDAVFYLAEAARKLNLEQEAQQNYQLYLAAVPDGASAKAARKALGELGATSKP